MSEVNVQIQNPKQTVNINNPVITIEMPTDSITVEILEGQPIEIQVQNPIIEVNIGGPCDCGDGGGGHTIQDEGTDLPAQPKLNFIGAGVTAADNPGNGSTDVTIPGGAGGIIEITYAEMADLIAAGVLDPADGLIPGARYLITDAAGTDGGFLSIAPDAVTPGVSGYGNYRNADFQNIGDYSGVEAITGVTPGTQLGIWRTGFEALTIAYTNLSGGTFAVGDTITGGTTGATATIITDGGASSMTAYMTSAGVAFDGSEVLDNGNGVTADQDGAAGSPTIVLGDIVIWSLTHYQLTDATLLDGTDPATNTAAYTLLDKATGNVGYVTAWDVSEYDFANDSIEYRQDLRGGLVRGATGAGGYQFGRDDCAGNNIQSPATFDIRNLIASFNNNTAFPGAIVSEIVTGTDTLIENNILENAASLTGITAGANCSISRNKIGQGATLGGSTTMGDGALIDDNLLGSSARLQNVTMGVDSEIAFNSMDNESAIQNIIAGNEAQIVRNRMMPGAEINSVTIDNELSISRNVILRSLSNLAIIDGGEISGSEIYLNISEKNITSGIFASIREGSSTAIETIDITGLTALDCLAENNYVGIFNLTSSNATETIAADSLTNFPTLFPFRLVPTEGLELTLTCTAAASAVAGSIVGSAGTIVLDGTNGDFVELEADATGTFVRVKNLQVYA